MRPTSLTLKNFKSIGADAQQIDLAPITLLFGPNSAGKSTVLQALIYLREVLHNRNLNPDKTVLGGDWLDLGGFQNLIHGRDLNEAIEISLGFELNETSLPIRLTDHERAVLDDAGIAQPENILDSINEAKISIKVRWSHVLSAPFVECFESYIDGELFSRIVCSADCKQIYLDFLAVEHAVLKKSYYYESESDDSLSYLFCGLINLSRSIQANQGLKDILVSDRPFKGFTVDEMEEFADFSGRDSEVLKKIIEELNDRSSRSAFALAKKLNELLARPDENCNRNVIQYLGVLGQIDALPSINSGLQLDSDVWLSDFEEAEIDSGVLKLLGQACFDALSIGPLQLVSKWLDDFTYIGPLRDLPPRNMTASLTPNRSRWAKGLAAWEEIYSASDQLIDEINYWMGGACLKTGYQVKLKKYKEIDLDNPVFSVLSQEPDFDQLLVIKEILEDISKKSRVYLQEELSNLEVMPQDIGVGISQLFPVVVLTILQKNGLIAIEQPELHIHPAIQVELADLFARYALKHNKFILLETHSEHLILRLLRRIREKTESNVPPDKQGLTKDSISVQYVEPAAAGTQFRQLRIDDTGDFMDEWPNGFFEERDEELFF